MNARSTTVALALAATSLPTSAQADAPLTIRPGTFAQAAPSASRAELESIARNVAQAALAGPHEFGPVSIVDLPRGERAVHLPQHHLGLPVLDRSAVVVFTKGGTARLLSARVESALPSSVTPAITAAAAAQTAARLTGLQPDANRAHLLVWSGPNGSRLAYGVDPVAIPMLPSRPVVIVDALTGAPLIAYNAAVELNAAKVYPTNPIKSPDLADVTLPVGDGQTTLTSPTIVSKGCIDKHVVKDVSMQGFTLSIHICDLVQSAVPDENGDYLTAPGADADPADAFAEISMFHHASRCDAFFRGFSPTLNLNAGAPLPTISNLQIPAGLDSFDMGAMADPKLPLVPFQNAFFAPENPLFAAIFDISGGAMWFGQGPVRDYSYDGDVIYHEFTHAVVNVTLKLVQTPHLDTYGVSVAPGAMNEGLADYFSGAIGGDSAIGEYAIGDFGEGSSIRDMSGPDTCPLNVGGEVHQDSVMFSGALWDVRTGLADADRAIFDAAVFTMMGSSPTGDLGFTDVADLLAASVKASPLGQAGADAVAAAFAKRGIAPTCSRVLEATAEPMKGPESLKGLWFAPGSIATGAASKTGWTPGVIQFHVRITEPAGKLTIAFDDVDVGGGGGFGMGTPYSPAVLVRFGDSPIQFSYSPLKATDGTIEVPVSGTQHELAEVNVPEGATEAYVMIGNAGESDGAYTAVSIAAVEGQVVVGEDVGGADAGSDVGTDPGAGADASTSADAGPTDDTVATDSDVGTSGESDIAADAMTGGDAGNNVTAPTAASDDSGGCAMDAPGPGKSVAGALLTLLALLGGVVMRRRAAR